MKQEELKEKVSEISQNTKQRIETSPVPAVLFAFAIGFLAGVFRALLIPLIFLAIVAAGVAWLMAEKPDSGLDIDAEVEEKTGASSKASKNDTKSDGGATLQ
jgi:flagellar biosynthesis component FlhA